MTPSAAPARTKWSYRPRYPRPAMKVSVLSSSRLSMQLRSRMFGAAPALLVFAALVLLAFDALTPLAAFLMCFAIVLEFLARKLVVVAGHTLQQGEHIPLDRLAKLCERQVVR